MGQEDDAIKMLRGMPPDQQRAVLTRLPKDKVQSIMQQLTPKPDANDSTWPNVTGFSGKAPATGMLGKAEELIGNLQEKLRSVTEVNPAVHKNDSSGDLLTSPVRGVLGMAKGVTEVPQGKVWQGAKDMGGGAIAAAQIPAMFMPPVAGGVRAVEGMLESEQAAKYLTDAVNPLPRHMATYQKSLGEHLDKILAFAKEKGMPLDSLDGFLKAIHGTGDVIHSYYYENILGPVKDRIASITNIPGYSGARTAGEGASSSATLKQLDDRLTQINADLNPKYAKGGIAASAAVKSSAELNAEAAAIRAQLYSEVGKATGLSPDVVSQTRGSMGALRDLAEKTETSLASARHATNAAKQAPITVNPFGNSGKQFVADKAIAAVRGNPVDRAIKQVLSRTNVPGYEMPRAVPQAMKAAIRSTPVRDVGEGTEIGISEPLAAERSAVGEKLSARQAANQAANDKRAAAALQRRTAIETVQAGRKAKVLGTASKEIGVSEPTASERAAIGEKLMARQKTVLANRATEAAARAARVARVPAWKAATP